jgi:hypothetical protein
MHPSAASTHPTSTESHGFDKHYCWMIRHVEQTAQKVLHVFDMFRDRFIIDSELDEDEIRIGGDMEREAEGEVIRPGGWRGCQTCYLDEISPTYPVQRRSP